MPSVAGTQSKSHVAVAAKWTYAVLGLALLFVLMPFLFWRATWFGRPLTDAQLASALADADHPREIQHGLSQISDRMVRGDPSVKQFYPAVIGLAANRKDEIRTMDAWVMGQDNSSPEFHAALLHLLKDSNATVQRNAALALVRFHDASGHDVISAMLRASVLRAPNSGVLRVRAKDGETVNAGDSLGSISSAQGKSALTAQMAGRLGQWLASDGASVVSGQPVVSILPSDDTVWEALRALYLIGSPDDLEIIAPYARNPDEARPQIAEQAQLTMKAIRSRARSQSAPVSESQ